MKTLFFICLTLGLCFAKPHNRVVDFTTQVKKKNFEKAVKVLIKGSPLEERFAEGSPQRVELVTRLFQASEAYGHLISIDLIQTQKIGKVKRHIYFMNYSKSAIRLDVLFYKPKKSGICSAIFFR
jgi:hypothetical protein